MHILLFDGLLRVAAAIAVAGGLTSCLTSGGGSRMSGQALYLQAIGGVASLPGAGGVDTVSYWDGDGLSGSPVIRINLAEQKAYFSKGGELAGVSMISSGREGFSTPRGRYKIIQKNRDHRSNLYGEIVDANGTVVNNDADVRKDPIPPGGRFVGSPMPYFMRIHGGVGMHVGYLPGFAASHGCIRMPEKMAVHFWENAPLGTPVVVE